MARTPTSRSARKAAKRWLSGADGMLLSPKARARRLARIPTDMFRGRDDAYPCERVREAAREELSAAGRATGGQGRIPANRNVCEAAREGLSGDGRTRACSTMMSRADVGGLKGGRWAVRPLPPTVSLQPHAVARCAGPLPLLFRRREERRDFISPSI